MKMYANDITVYAIADNANDQSLIQTSSILELVGPIVGN